MRLLPLLSEAFVGSEWVQVGQPISAGDRPGSISTVASGQREVYLFKCEGNTSYVYRSEGGVDVESGHIRVVSSTEGLVPVAQLTNGQSYETAYRSERMPTSMKIRFRHVD